METAEKTTPRLEWRVRCRLYEQETKQYPKVFFDFDPLIESIINAGEKDKTLGWVRANINGIFFVLGCFRDLSLNLYLSDVDYFYYEKNQEWLSTTKTNLLHTSHNEELIQRFVDKFHNGVGYYSRED
jgi:hypothetical protein